MSNRSSPLSAGRVGTCTRALPRVACLCATYKRPLLLAEAIESFIRQAAVEVLSGGDIAVPSTCWVYADQEIKSWPTHGLFHSGWSFTRETFDRAGGYPPRKNDEDQAFAHRVQECGATFVDPCQAAPASFIYRWDIPVTHISAVPASEYERLADEPADRVEWLRPHWDRDWVEAVRLADERRVDSPDPER